MFVLFLAHPVAMSCMYLVGNTAFNISACLSDHWLC